MISNSLRDSSDDTDKKQKKPRNHHKYRLWGRGWYKETITNISDDDEKVSKPKQSTNNQINKKKKKVWLFSTQPLNLFTLYKRLSI